MCRKPAWSAPSVAAVALQGRDSSLAASILALSRRSRFAQKAAPVLDLYQRCWEGQPLHDDAFVISANEKTSIQARCRTHASTPARPRRAMRVEHEHQRCGASAYLAALDVHRAHVVGRCEAQTGIAPFCRLVERVMATAPYRGARRVFWIVDNGSSHRGARCIQRAQSWDPRLQLVHTPCHASWLNRIEIYRDLLLDRATQGPDAKRLRRHRGARRPPRDFESHFARIGKPFEWNLTRNHLTKLLKKLDSPSLADSARMRCRTYDQAVLSWL